MRATTGKRQLNKIPYFAAAYYALTVENQGGYSKIVLNITHSGMGIVQPTF
jgi:hypothetical protein